MERCVSHVQQHWRQTSNIHWPWTNPWIHCIVKVGPFSSYWGSLYWCQGYIHQTQSIYNKYGSLPKKKFSQPDFSGIYWSYVSHWCTSDALRLLCGYFTRVKNFWFVEWKSSLVRKIVKIKVQIPLYDLSAFHPGQKGSWYFPCQMSFLKRS